MTKISIDERDAHLRAVIKSNVIGFGLEPVIIDFITQNLTDDVLDVLANFDKVNGIVHEDLENVAGI